MSLSRGSVADFFAPRAEDGPLLEARREALASHPERTLAFLPDAGAELAETAEVLEAADLARLPSRGMPDALLRGLGGSFAPDLLVLGPRGECLVLVAGAVCFPSSWSLEEKLGRTLPAIHAPVPGLEDSLGPAIARFLDALPVGDAYLRSNFGLAASAALDQHPLADVPRLGVGADLEEVHVRIEDQAFVRLPRTRGVLFGIRIRTFPLLALRDDRAALVGLRRALASMPEPMAAYKGLREVRAPLVERLGALLGEPDSPSA
ncbi:MAG: DUF3445 domain-containing protein [Polyangiales bacterium]